MRQLVKIVGAPGYADGWQASLLTSVAAVDSRGPLSIVEDTDGDQHVIPTRYVQEISADWRTDTEPTTRQVAQDDRDYWEDRYAEADDESDDE